VKLWTGNKKQAQEEADGVEGESRTQQLAKQHCANACQLLSAGQSDEAVAEFQQALKIDGECYVAHYNLGVIYSERGQSSKALKSYELATRYGTDYFEAYNALGLAYGNAVRVVDSICAFLRAIRIKPDYLEAHINLARTYYNGGRYEEAVKACHKALQLQPKLPEPYYILGLIRIDLRDKEGALEQHAKLRQLNVEQGDLLLRSIYREFRF